MEALVCRDSLLLARQHGVAKICLETYCLGLINLWESLDDQRSAVNLVLCDIKVLSRSFDEFTFVYANRDCNRVAHVCARQVSRDFVAEEWHDNPPLVLRDLLLSDCNYEVD